MSNAITRADLIDEMVKALRCVDVDLGDERDVMRKLSSLRYASGDIVACIDEVIETTRKRGLHHHTFGA